MLTRPTPDSCAIFGASRVSARSSTLESGSVVDVSANRDTLVISGPDARELLILADDVPAGYAVVDRTSPVWRLLDIAIAIEHQRRGIATHVVRRWQEDASRNGSVIALSVLRSNTAARSLYDRLGFRVTEEDDTRWQMEWQG